MTELYRIAGQNYWRPAFLVQSHIVRMAAVATTSPGPVAAGRITEVKSGAGPVATTNCGVSPMEHDRPFQG